MNAAFVLAASIAAACFVTIGALLLVIDETRSGTQTESFRGEPRPSDRLTICVHSVDLSQEIQPAAKLAVEAALEELVMHPVWQDTPYSKSPPEVREGCPRGPALKDRQRNFDDAVDTPSYFEIHVFVLPQAEVERIIGSSTGRGYAEEFQCSGDACAEVTSGIYIGDQELDDDAFLVTQIDNAIGLSASLVLE